MRWQKLISGSDYPSLPNRRGGGVVCVCVCVRVPIICISLYIYIYIYICACDNTSHVINRRVYKVWRGGGGVSIEKS